jgi:hypothetical protein
MKKTTIITGLLLLTLVPGSLFAYELGKLQINGFVSQGYLDSSDNNFLDPKSKDGTFRISEVGLTFNAPLTEKLHIGTQALYRILGEDEDFGIDWAYGDYRFTDWFGMRAGKIKLPIGLYNETRDSDFLRPMVFLPQSVYDEMQRSFLVAGLGASIYGNIPTKSIGDFDYQLFYGQIDVDEDITLVDQGLNIEGMDSIVKGYSGGMAGVDDFDYEPDYTFAASLVYNTALDGLRLGGTYFKSKGKFNTSINDPLGIFEGEYGVTNFDIDANYDHMYVLSAEYVLPLVTFSAEYMQRDNDVKATGIAALPGIGNRYNFVTTTSEGWYVMATVQVPPVPGLSVTALYDEFYLDKNDKNDGNFRKDFGIGTRYDINKNWLVKAEWHSIDGKAMNVDLVNDDPVEEDWSYFTVKTTFNF